MENTGGMVGREEKRDGPLSREEKRGMDVITARDEERTSKLLILMRC